jgi:hypothetical protein
MLDISKACDGSPEAIDAPGCPLDPGGANGQSAFPSFNFYALPLSLIARHQLSHIYKTRRCWQLADLIRRHAFDPGCGYYVPVSMDVYLARKLPEVLGTLNPEGNRQQPFRATFFTNALLVPEGYGSLAWAHAPMHYPSATLVRAIENCGRLRNGDALHGVPECLNEIRQSWG